MLLIDPVGWIVTAMHFHLIQANKIFKNELIRNCLLLVNQRLDKWGFRNIFSGNPGLVKEWVLVYLAATKQVQEKTYIKYIDS